MTQDELLVIEKLAGLLNVKEQSVTELEKNLLIVEEALTPLMTQNSQITRQSQRVLATTAMIAVRKARRNIDDLKVAVREDTHQRILQ